MNNKLARYRKFNGFNQTEVSEALHVTRVTVSNWERGVTKPTQEMKLRLATLLNTTVSDLFDVNE